MTLSLPTASRNAAADAVVDRLDAGAGAPTIKVYSGSKPASANDAATGTLLVTFTLDGTAAFGAAGATTAGQADLDVSPAISATAAATGTAGWFRAADSDGNTVFDGTAGTTGTDLILNSTSITSGATVNLLSGSVTMPA